MGKPSTGSLRDGLDPLESRMLRDAAAGFDGSVLVAGSAVGRLTAAVRTLVPRLPIDALLNEASDAIEIERASARPLSSIDEAEEGYGLAIWRPTGREGKARQRMLARRMIELTARDGRLVVFTHKMGGAKAIVEALEASGGTIERTMRSGSGQRLLLVTPGPAGPAVPSVPAPAEALFSTHFRGKDFSFETAPGLFSRDHLDEGSRLVLEAVAGSPASRMLDLGCGYGAIGIVLAAFNPEARVTLVDKDPLAVQLARRNAARNGVEERTEICLSDGLTALPASALFDLAVIHFPLHVPREELNALLTGARDQLAAGGRMVGVLLKAYDLAPHLGRIFRTVRQIDGDERFAVLECTGKAA